MKCPKSGLDCNVDVTGCMQGFCALSPPQKEWVPIPTPLPPHQLGWQCPKCGRGNAPWNAVCPCGPAFSIAHGSGVSG